MCKQQEASRVSCARCSDGFAVSRHMSGKEEKKLDFFRDTPVRLLGYANEVGEAFRQLIPLGVVRFSYAVATTYCLSDATSKAVEVTKEVGEESSNRKAIEMFIEAVIWQGLASVIIPGFSINRICWLSSNMLKNVSIVSATKQKWMVTSIGLACVPIIIKPIDRLVDAVIDKGVMLTKDIGIEHRLPHEDKKFHDILVDESYVKKE